MQRCPVQCNSGFGADDEPWQLAHRPKSYTSGHISATCHTRSAHYRADARAAPESLEGRWYVSRGRFLCVGRWRARERGFIMRRPPMTPLLLGLSTASFVTVCAAILMETSTLVCVEFLPAPLW